jgi:hypothetical protein
VVLVFLDFNRAVKSRWGPEKNLFKIMFRDLPRKKSNTTPPEEVFAEGSVQNDVLLFFVNYRLDG